MLLVLAIVGILATVVALGFTDSGRHRHLRAEAERLARLTELARGEALRRNEIWGLRVTEGRFRFQRYDHAAGDWMEVAGRPFGARQAEEAVTFRITTAAGDRKLLVEQFEALRDEAADPNREAAEPPDVVIYPGGEVTPFEVTVFLQRAQRGDEDEGAWVAYTDGIQGVRARSARDASQGRQGDLLADVEWRE